MFGESFAGFLVALGVGLLIGIERERRKRGDPQVGAAGGVRTHAIVALAGALATEFAGVALLAVGAAFIAALVLVSYWRDRSEDIGVTSEVTLFATYLLGALAHGAPALAAAIGIIIALILALRSVLHRFVTGALSDQEVLDFLLLAGAVLVVLPLMPDRTIDRYGVVNPHDIWKLTVLVLGINGLSYLALRTLGPGRGLPLAGFLGGMVSSSATIAAMGARARGDASLLPAAVSAGLLSSVATAVQLVLVLAVINPAMLRIWIPAAIAMAMVAALAGVWQLRSSALPRDGVAQTFFGRAFQPTQALVFSVTVTAILWSAAWLHDFFGALGALLGIALGGLADAHSATASAGTLVLQGQLDMATATLAILLAVLTNTGTKLLLAAASGGRGYFMRLAPPLLLMPAAAALVLWALT